MSCTVSTYTYLTNTLEYYKYSRKIEEKNISSFNFPLRITLNNDDIN